MPHDYPEARPAALTHRPGPARRPAPWRLIALVKAVAADMLFALISSDMIVALTVDRRWPKARLGERLSLLFRATFVEG